MVEVSNMSDQMPELYTKQYVSVPKKEAFLVALRETGLNVSAACRKAGIASTAGVYTQRKLDPVFAQQWQEIEEELLDHLEELQFKSALERPEDRRWVLARLRPKFSEHRHTHITGEVAVRSMRELSDSELEALIARGRVEGEYTVEDGDQEEDQGDHQ